LQGIKWVVAGLHCLSAFVGFNASTSSVRQDQSRSETDRAVINLGAARQLASVIHGVQHGGRRVGVRRRGWSSVRELREQTEMMRHRDTRSLRSSDVRSMTAGRRLTQPKTAGACAISPTTDVYAGRPCPRTTVTLETTHIAARPPTPPHTRPRPFSFALRP